MMRKDEKRRTGTTPPRDLPQLPVVHLRQTVPLGHVERPGGQIQFTTTDGTIVGARIIAVWRDGVTLRRTDTDTTQYLGRGDYKLVEE